MASENEQESRETSADIADEIRRAVESMGDEMPYTVSAGTMRRVADRIEAIAKRERDELVYAYDPTKAGRGRLPDGSAYALEAMREPVQNSHTIGNAAAMREALTKISESATYALKYRHDGLDYGDLYGFIEEMGEDARAALSAPARNCDLPLVVDGPADNNADKAWLVFKEHNPDAYFDVSGLLRCMDWILAPAAERKGE